LACPYRCTSLDALWQTMLVSPDGRYRMLDEEQPKPSFREALRHADLLEREDFLILCWNETIGVSWEEVACYAIRKAKELAGISKFNFFDQYLTFTH